MPWKELGVDVVIESTGVFIERRGPAKHLQAGAKKVIISAPGEGARHHALHGHQPRRVRPGQAPRDLERVVHDQLPRARSPRCCTETFGIGSGMMTTIHSYTNDQNILDLPHKDLRRARAAARQR